MNWCRLAELFVVSVFLSFFVSVSFRLLPSLFLLYFIFIIFYYLLFATSIHFHSLLRMALEMFWGLINFALRLGLKSTVWYWTPWGYWVSSLDRECLFLSLPLSSSDADGISSRWLGVPIFVFSTPSRARTLRGRQSKWTLSSLCPFSCRLPSTVSSRFLMGGRLLDSWGRPSLVGSVWSPSLGLSAMILSSVNVVCLPPPAPPPCL